MENPDSPSLPPKIRLQVFLRDQGLGSRRACDAMVATGKVQVNGRPVTEPTVHLVSGDQVSVEDRTFHVGDKAIPHRYLRYHKPPGLLCTHADEHHRKTIFTQLGEAMDLAGGRLFFFAGRLDAPSRGLMVLSTDGPWIQKLIHPSHGQTREYEVTLGTAVSDETMAALSRGVTQGGIAYGPFTHTRLGPKQFRLVLSEGKKREIRHIFEAGGAEVVDLCRIRLGTYTLNGLTEGTWEWLEPG